MTIQRPDSGDLQASDPAAQERHAHQVHRVDPSEHQHGAGHQHGGHGLMMMACCVPMIVIAVSLVVTGAAGSGVIVAALLCTAMMAAMMFAMPGGHGHK